MGTRLEKILACIDVSTETGLEVGALVNPIVTRDMGKIRYIDHATTAELQAKYAHDPNVDIHKIVEVDYVWGKEGLPELVGQDAPFDYLIASHVIEHVPDFIGWLKEIHAVLKVGGILSLVIPDKRYCFDYYRNTTQTSDVIEAFLESYRKPSPRQVFDYIASAVTYHNSIVWDSTSVIKESELQRIHSEEEAWNLAQMSALDSQYIDSHCWVFTPFSFFELLRSLIKLELFDFKVEKFYETAGCEFYVSLAALDRSDGSSTERIQVQLASLPTLPIDLSTISSVKATDDVAHAVAQKKIQNLTSRLEDAQREIHALKNSKAWKITAPLRWLRNRF